MIGKSSLNAFVEIDINEDSRLMVLTQGQPYMIPQSLGASGNHYESGEWSSLSDGYTSHQM